MNSSDLKESTGKKIWQCKTCNEIFEPDGQNYNCPRCGGIAFPTYNIETGVPKKPLIEPYEKICRFQVENEKTRKREEYFKCELTGIGSTRAISGMDYGVNVQYGPCVPDLCPMYQTWKLLEKKKNK